MASAYKWKVKPISLKLARARNVHILQVRPAVLPHLRRTDRCEQRKALSFLPRALSVKVGAEKIKASDRLLCGAKEMASEKM